MDNSKRSKTVQIHRTTTTATFTLRKIPSLSINTTNNVINRPFATISLDIESDEDQKKRKGETSFSPTMAQLLKRPVAIVALIPKQFSLFAAGAVAGAAAKSVTAPLDRIKLLMQAGELIDHVPK